ncbi:hypothetical protein [Bacillus sp. AFS023182]|uniref:hypothetical protein n=1 Tax=Bacillus sp. AFS023182 TaxID=2033492 RepID=UPI0015971046|nr:hypothetical protein [Bacillus sp. AFS023182]
MGRIASSSFLPECVEFGMKEETLNSLSFVVFLYERGKNIEDMWIKRLSSEELGACEKT